MLSVCMCPRVVSNATEQTCFRIAGPTFNFRSLKKRLSLCKKQTINTKIDIMLNIYKFNVKKIQTLVNHIVRTSLQYHNKSSQYIIFK